MVVSGNGSISYSDYNEGSLNRSIYPSTDRPSPPVILFKETSYVSVSAKDIANRVKGNKGNKTNRFTYAFPYFPLLLIITTTSYSFRGLSLIPSVMSVAG